MQGIVFAGPRDLGMDIFVSQRRGRSRGWEGNGEVGRCVIHTTTLVQVEFHASVFLPVKWG